MFAVVVVVVVFDAGVCTEAKDQRHTPFVVYYLVDSQVGTAIYWVKHKCGNI